MVTITLIRHGESRDNTKTIWAGWKDAPLSALGERQANAVGTYFHDSSIQFTHIYSSDLSRAHSTALAVLRHHAEPKPPLVVTPKLREQHFGVAEGQPWTIDVYPGKSIEELSKEGIFPDLTSKGRDLKFPEGESLNDVATRVEEAIKEFIIPHVFAKDQAAVQIAFASHGICISETISALLRLDPEVEQLKQYKGHHNTGWSQVEISPKADHTGDYDPSSPPPVRVRLLTFNNYGHLSSLPAPSSENAQARAFFSGSN
ncbi:hypothetical protein AGABI2DRAFT_120270 [Agaricus bisporus var. bisporus H97]|uniref:hypothetical protein n=1 Tax=Agaricus bisporus var. bisporus (strain H97 / ATCC MYA-4626 / FGSC 10389) TaxID=936046 RepID=UPI00029F7877|nr:hypothetical protein AGABI2DRAFT_120270 [Agaricus bisporus var. bisporus H97]EKV45309.1 hypothetical protein AGABI2DRAFT_120270 [Agaricus bisporus var. bisporus H97]